MTIPLDVTNATEQLETWVAELQAGAMLGSVNQSFPTLRAVLQEARDRLTVRRGSIAAIIGPNGAGKTSLLNCIAGFYRPQRGRIVFEGRDVTRVPAARLASTGRF